ncbi:MAG: hypothetical protein AB1714_01610 [Acidobacteriota bacterium]
MIGRSVTGLSLLVLVAAPLMGGNPNVDYLKKNYGDVPKRVAQEVSAARILGSALPEIFSNFEDYKGFAYYTFTGTLPYIFDPLRHRDSVRAGALWETVGKPVAQTYMKLGGNIKEVDGIRIQIKTASKSSMMPVQPTDTNETIGYVFTVAQLRRFLDGEITTRDLFDRSQVLFNGANIKVDFAADGVQIEALARDITTFRLRTER